MYSNLESFFTANTQLEVFLISCGIGVLLGLIYDIFRIVRITIPHSDLLVAIEDVLLLICYGIFLMCFAFSLMRGQIRFFFIMGNLLGFLIWFFTIGNIIVKVAYRIKGYILKLIGIFTYPIKKILALLKKK
ncbi:MAG: spore cortex biosynthesis protein YabQ [Ruminococcus sp.]|nr:spore cortex biosynthesis protein YabQ [Ruminococcus sp.]